MGDDRDAVGDSALVASCDEAKDDHWTIGEIGVADLAPVGDDPAGVDKRAGRPEAASTRDASVDDASVREILATGCTKDDHADVVGALPGGQRQDRGIDRDRNGRNGEEHCGDRREYPDAARPATGAAVDV